MEPARPRTRREKLETEIAWLNEQLARVYRERERAPWLLAGLVLVFPAGYFFGFLAVAFVVVIVGAMTGCAFYLCFGHRIEYEGKIARLRADLEALEANEKQGAAT